MREEDGRKKISDGKSIAEYVPTSTSKWKNGLE